MEKKKRLPIGVIILFIVLGVLLLIILFFIIWLSLPVKAIPAEILLPPETVATFALNFDSENPGMTALKAGTEDYLFGTILPGKIPFSGQLFKAFFPKQVTGILTLDPESGSPELAGIVSMSKAVKLVSLFSNQVDKALFNNLPVKKQKVGMDSYWSLEKVPEDANLTSYAVLGNNLLAGTSDSIIRGSLVSYQEGYSSQPHLQKIADRLSDQITRADGHIYMDNSGQGISGLITAVEEKVAFAAFPSIDAIAYIEGTLSLSTAELTGLLSCYCRDAARIEEVKSDIKFFYGALRRVLRAQNLNLRGDVIIKGSTVTLDFNIENFIDNLIEYLKSDQGGNEE